MKHIYLCYIYSYFLHQFKFYHVLFSYLFLRLFFSSVYVCGKHTICNHVTFPCTHERTNKNTHIYKYVYLNMWFRMHIRESIHIHTHLYMYSCGCSSMLLKDIYFHADVINWFAQQSTTYSMWKIEKYFYTFYENVLRLCTLSCPCPPPTVCIAIVCVCVRVFYELFVVVGVVVILLFSCFLGFSVISENFCFDRTYVPLYHSVSQSNEVILSQTYGVVIIYLFSLFIFWFGYLFSSFPPVCEQKLSKREM